jgi:surface polysaccharide O-acyltransferase-like enzyme
LSLSGNWRRAQELAERTPARRNRSVDFLRAASIAVVVIGHWLMAAAWLDDGRLRMGDMLHFAPWTQWLTWAFQVMPLFFMVGGYANGVSWQSARRKGLGYHLWLSTRLQRLLGPVLPLLLVWVMLAVLASQAGVEPSLIRLGSQAAFIPTWFLAVYIMVVVTTPLSWRAWRRFGPASFIVLALCAALVDMVSFSNDLPLLRWVNYAFVWLAVHQLGYLWRDRRILGPGQALLWSAGGLAVLLLLVTAAGYPVSMITVPGETVSNSRPPSLALLSLAVFHAGLVISLETPLRRWLKRPVPWTITVLVNGRIMTLYLWHVTVMILAIGALNLLGGPGLGIEPDSGLWWATRPVWIGLLAILLLPAMALFGRFEQGSRKGAAASPPAWRSIAGAVAISGALATLALNGIHSEGITGIRVEIIALALAGIALVFGYPRHGSATSQAG